MFDFLENYSPHHQRLYFLEWIEKMMAAVECQNLKELQSQICMHNSLRSGWWYVVGILYSSNIWYISESFTLPRLSKE